MLTKEHLKHRIRQNRVKPVLLAGTSEEIGLADRLVEHFAQAGGRTRLALERDLAGEDGTLAPAFCKLLWDRTEESDEDPAIKEERWRAFELAAEMRADFVGSPEEWRDTVAAKMGNQGDALRDALYGDLPECRQIASFRSLSGAELVQRYNCAQVQGLLLHAIDFTVDLTHCTLAERRAFFRQLKFHRLLAEVGSDPSGKKMLIQLSGPLSLFDNAQAYGMRLAQFFPHVLNLSRFKLAAVVKVKRKEVTLKIDEKTGIQSHYRKHGGHLPADIRECLAQYAEKYQPDLGIAIEPNLEFLHLGKQSYCFPDFKFKVDGETYYIELFHRWHKHQLEGRIAAAGDDSRLILGVARAALPKGVKIAEMTTRKAFTFREFPTAGQLRTAVKSVLTN